MQALLGRARDFLPFSRPDPRQVVCDEAPKLYQKPRLTKLTPEQARLILFGHAGVGDPGAKDLMGLVFSEGRPEPEERPGSEES